MCVYPPVAGCLRPVYHSLFRSCNFLLFGHSSSHHHPIPIPYSPLSISFDTQHCHHHHHHIHYHHFIRTIAQFRSALLNADSRYSLARYPTPAPPIITPIAVSRYHRLRQLVGLSRCPRRCSRTRRSHRLRPATHRPAAHRLASHSPTQPIVRLLASSFALYAHSTSFAFTLVVYSWIIFFAGPVELLPFGWRGATGPRVPSRYLSHY